LKHWLRWWLIVGAVSIAAAAAALLVDSESSVAGALTVVSIVWLAATAWAFAWRVWRWVTYRVGVRLFISYLLVGLLPILFGAAFAAVGLYIMMGQYTSVQFGSEMKRMRSELEAECHVVLDRLRTQGADEAAALLEELAATNPIPLPQVIWQARLGGRDVRLGGGAELPEIDWIEDDPHSIVIRHGDASYTVVAALSVSGDRVVALIPLDDVVARSVSESWWFDVAFFPLDEGSDDTAGDQSAEEDTTRAVVSSDGVINLTLDGDKLVGDQIWPEWTADDEGFLSQSLVVWFRVVVDVVDFATGEPIEDASLLALLRTSPKAVWRDFTLSRYELGAHIWGIFAGLGLFFLFGYGLALAVATTMILSITRSVKRLSAGALEVERGNLNHRVPVKRRDQLGDLGRSFNHMTGAVQSMLDDVAEKERLAQELELAREIQESLLPARHLEVGPLTVRATFQPAAEVGGDYFDVFPLSEDRLVVTIGDVAGHGLSTGLLMASLKSSVAALVHEGYAGADLIERVNRLLVEHGQSRTMVTLSVIEIDLAEDRLRLANAGHPPAFLVTAEGGAEELMAGSLPLGTRLCRPAVLERPFPVGSLLLAYSDGLVEAASADGEPFGYDRLERILSDAADQPGSALTAVILDQLSGFTAGADLADDLTLLVVERNG
jgi:serine phosphatase RsbU (regulator of sigma subunit)